MQINLNGAAAVTGIAAGNPVKTVATDQGLAQPSEPQDTTSLSQNSLEAPSLTAQALATSEARAAKVEALRQAVVSATYVVDPALIADAIISAGI